MDTMAAWASRLAFAMSCAMRIVSMKSMSFFASAEGGTLEP